MTNTSLIFKTKLENQWIFLEFRCSFLGVSPAQLKETHIIDFTLTATICNRETFVFFFSWEMMNDYRTTFPAIIVLLLKKVSLHSILNEVLFDIFSPSPSKIKRILKLLRQAFNIKIQTYFVILKRSFFWMICAARNFIDMKSRLFIIKHT